MCSNRGFHRVKDAMGFFSRLFPPKLTSLVVRIDGLLLDD